MSIDEFHEMKLLSVEEVPWHRIAFIQVKRYEVEVRLELVGGPVESMPLLGTVQRFAVELVSKDATWDMVHWANDAVEAGRLGEAIMLSGRLTALAQQDGVAEELYAALSNTQWIDGRGERWACTWRCAGDIAAAVRGRPGDNYLVFYCSGEEGRVSDRMRDEFGRLGWRQVLDREAEA